MNLEGIFAPFSAIVSRIAGGPVLFLAAFALVLVWAAFGPVTGYSEAWMLVINTATTIITFLMVFIIQSSQNRDTAALQVKIDELIRATEGASNRLIDLEQLYPSEIAALRLHYLHIAEKARLRSGPFDPETRPRADETAEERNGTAMPRHLDLGCDVDPGRDGTGGNPTHLENAIETEDKTMADDKSKRGKTDRIRVAAGQKHEVAYFGGKHGQSASEARSTIAKAGPMRVKANAAAKSVRKSARSG
jgi:low affinity Fe/Cu permease